MIDHGPNVIDQVVATFFAAPRSYTAEDLVEIIMRRFERFSTLLTSNRPVEDWGKLLGKWLQ